MGSTILSFRPLLSALQYAQKVKYHGILKTIRMANTTTNPIQPASRGLLFAPTTIPVYKRSSLTRQSDALKSSLFGEYGLKGLKK